MSCLEHHHVFVRHLFGKRDRFASRFGCIACLLRDDATAFRFGVSERAVLAHHDLARVANSSPREHDDLVAGQRNQRRPADRIFLDVRHRLDIFCIQDHVHQFKRDMCVATGTVDVQNDHVDTRIDRLFEFAFQQRSAQRIDVFMQRNDHRAAVTTLGWISFFGFGYVVNLLYIIRHYCRIRLCAISHCRFSVCIGPHGHIGGPHPNSQTQCKKSQNANDGVKLRGTNGGNVFHTELDFKSRTLPVIHSSILSIQLGLRNGPARRADLRRGQYGLKI